MIILVVTGCKTAEYYRATYAISEVQGIDFNETIVNFLYFDSTVNKYIHKLRYIDTVKCNSRYCKVKLMKNDTLKGGNIKIYDNRFIKLCSRGRTLSQYNVEMIDKIIFPMQQR